MQVCSGCGKQVWKAVMQVRCVSAFHRHLLCVGWAAGVCCACILGERQVWDRIGAWCQMCLHFVCSAHPLHFCVLCSPAPLLCALVTHSTSPTPFLCAVLNRSILCVLCCGEARTWVPMDHHLQWHLCAHCRSSSHAHAPALVVAPPKTRRPMRPQEDDDSGNSQCRAVGSVDTLVFHDGGITR